MNKVFLFLLFFCISLSTTSYSQSPILLVNADSIVGYTVNDKPVRDFIGNVHLRQNNVDLFCNKAIHYIQENKAILIGAVRIIQDTLTLTSEYIEYDGTKSLANSTSKIEIKDPQNVLKANYGIYNFSTRIANFFENVLYEERQVKLLAQRMDFDRTNQIVYAYSKVKLETDSLIILCDTLIYSKSKNTLNASGKVQTRAKYESLILLSGKLFFDRQNNFSISTDAPVLLLVDTIKVEEDSIDVKLDTLWLFADTLVSQTSDNETIFSFISNVKLFKSEVVSIGNLGKLWRNSEFGYLIGKPILWYDSTEFRGDSLYFRMREKKISFVEFVGNSFILSPSNIDTTYVHKIQSDTINIFFVQNKVDYILGVGKVITNYFLKNEDTGEIQLANYISDSVKVNFVDNEVDNVVWISNVSGEVIPEVLFAKNLEKYYTFPKDFLKNRPVLNYFRKNLLNYSR